MGLYEDSGRSEEYGPQHWSDDNPRVTREFRDSSGTRSKKGKEMEGFPSRELERDICGRFLHRGSVDTERIPWVFGDDCDATCDTKGIFGGSMSGADRSLGGTGRMRIGGWIWGSVGRAEIIAPRSRH
jgi:hypothetical protein